MTDADNSDGYVLSREVSEYERQRAQAAIWGPLTERVLDAAGLGPGMSALDAGCGPGEVMRLMGRRVGPTGRVTGIDIDAEVGPTACRDLRRRRRATSPSIRPI